MALAYNSIPRVTARLEEIQDPVKGLVQSGHSNSFVGPRQLSRITREEEPLLKTSIHTALGGDRCWAGTAHLELELGLAGHGDLELEGSEKLRVERGHLNLVLVLAVVDLQLPDL